MAYNPTVEPQDFIVLAGQQSPGIAVIMNAPTIFRWAKRRGYGFTKGTRIYRGQDLIDIKVRLVLTSQQDWDNWDIWRGLIQRPPQGERARAMDISHPLLEMADVRSVVVEEWELPREVGDTGEWAVDIKFGEFNQPTFALARPTASEPTQLTAEQQEIQRLTRQFDTLLSGSTP